MEKKSNTKNGGETDQAPAQAPAKQLKLGFNMCTACIGLPKLLTDEDVFSMLANKPGCSEL